MGHAKTAYDIQKQTNSVSMSLLQIKGTKLFWCAVKLHWVEERQLPVQKDNLKGQKAYLQP